MKMEARPSKFASGARHWFENNRVVVLSEFATTTGNFQSLARRIVEKVPTEKDTKMSFHSDGCVMLEWLRSWLLFFVSYVFHLAVEQTIVYMCMMQLDGDGKSQMRLPFAFLKETSVRPGFLFFILKNSAGRWDSVDSTGPAWERWHRQSATRPLLQTWGN